MTSISRRAFIAAGAAAGLAASLPAPAATPLPVGLVGCGDGGRALLSAMRDARSSLLPVAYARQSAQSDAAFSDLDRARDWRSLIERGDIDAILIATPDDLHADMASAALRAGKHVYLLPPFTRTAEEAQELASLARDCGRVLHIAADPAEDRRWAAAKTALEKTGAPLWIQAETPASMPPSETGWQRLRGASHGPAALHVFNMLYPMHHHLALGTLERATALGGVFNGAPEATPDALLMTLRYDGGATVVLACNDNARTRPAPSMRGVLDSVELPTVHNPNSAPHDLAHFAGAVAGDRSAAGARLQAAEAAQVAVCRAMDDWAKGQQRLC